MAEPFKPSVTYTHFGDLLKVYLEDEPAYAQQISDEITVLRAFSDKRIVGVKITNILVRVLDSDHMLAEK